MKKLLLLTAAVLSSSAAPAATVTVGYSDNSTGGAVVPLYSTGGGLTTVVNTFMGTFGVGASSTVAFGVPTSYEFAINDVYATQEDTVRLYATWSGITTPFPQLTIPTLFQSDEGPVAGFSLTTQLYVNDTLLGTQIFPNAAPSTYFPILDATVAANVGYTLTEVFTVSCSAACAAARIFGDVGGAIVATPSAVPLPAAVWLFGAGLSGLALMSRRKKSRKVEGES